MAEPHAAVGSCRYATHSGGFLVPKPIRHEHVVWEVHPASGELDTRSFGDGSLRQGRTKRLERGGWGPVVLNEEMKVMAKLHGPLPGLYKDMTLAESVAFLWYLRRVSAMGGSTPHNVLKGLRDGVAESCKAGEACSGSGRNPKDGGWLGEPTWHAVGRADVVQVAASKVGVVHELQRESGTTLTSHSCVRNMRNFVGPLRAVHQNVITKKGKSVRRRSCVWTRQRSWMNYRSFH